MAGVQLHAQADTEQEANGAQEVTLLPREVLRTHIPAGAVSNRQRIVVHFLRGELSDGREVTVALGSAATWSGIRVDGEAAAGPEELAGLLRQAPYRVRIAELQQGGEDLEIFNPPPPVEWGAVLPQGERSFSSVGESAGTGDPAPEVTYRRLD
jgi:hypothetical protein